MTRYESGLKQRSVALTVFLSYSRVRNLPVDTRDDHSVFNQFRADGPVLGVWVRTIFIKNDLIAVRADSAE